MTNDEIIGEFRRKYQHSYIFVEFPEESSCKEELFYVEAIEIEGNGKAFLHLRSDHLGKILLNINSDHTLKFKSPPCGVFQHEKDAYYFRRIPARQWQRGVCEANSSCLAVHKKYIRFGDGHLSYGLVKDAFARQVFDYRTAKDFIISGDLRSVALADNFSLVANLVGQAGFMLFFWECPIAIIEPNKGVIILQEPFTRQVGEIING